MNGLILFLAAGLGIDYGWTQDTDGSVEYIVQVDEAGLEALRDGLPLTAAVPSDLSRVDSIRIQIGEGSLPRTRIRQNKPPVVAASFTDVSQSASENIADAIKEKLSIIPAKLNTQSLEKLTPAAKNLIGETANDLARKAGSSLNDAANNTANNAADNAPTLVKQTGWGNAGSNGSQPETSVLQPTQPAAAQQEFKQPNGHTTVRNSTAIQPPVQPRSNGTDTSRSGSFGRPPVRPLNRTADAGKNGWSDPQNRNGGQPTQARQTQTQPRSGSGFFSTDTQQGQPQDNRNINPYNGQRTQVPDNRQSDNRQPGYDPGRNQPPANNVPDSRSGQTTNRNQSPGYRPQAPDYQSAFSAGGNSTRNNSLDIYSDANRDYDLAPIDRRPDQQVNKQFNSYQPGRQPAQQQNYQQPPYRQQTYPPQNYVQTNQQRQPQNPLTQQPYPPVNYAQPGQPNPYAIPPYQIPGFQTPPNPYAQTGVPGIPQNGYINPYSQSRSNQTEVMAELEKRLEKKYDEQRAADREEHEIRIKALTTQVSNQTGNQSGQEETKKPTTQWTTMLVFLFGSIGANFYLAWIGLSFYHKYRSLSEDMRDSLTDRLDSR